MHQKKLKLADLAKLAGVSTSTASRALNDNPLIKQETRERIQQLAKEHNFSLNAAASRLRLQKTKVIAVLINLDSETEQSIDDPFLLKVVSDINLAVNRQGYELLLSNSFMAGDDWHGYFIDGRRADGVIVVGQGKQQALIESASKAGMPLVVWGDPKTEADYVIVGSDNYLGGKLAADHLISRGCKAPLFLGEPEHAEIGERYSGFCAAIASKGIEEECQLLKIDITSQAAYDAINLKLRSDGLDFDGIFACSDMVALGAMKALKERYVSIPNDVHIVGFDDIAMADVSFPSLTTIRQDTKQAGELLVNKLLAQLDGEQVVSSQLAIKLVERQSS
ncbi:LacI family transcriptional regulator [Pseudoalteromonas luteoviolacea]|uniref:LacI family transcriptional regulator n=1 Tax=Pseudoalteromonas luteoviolacea TaxID=43657 RepID=A0A0C1QAE7_9GAMM|nr:LacI family DNA-binding transcriptional regulator [Pseudoalteromonas luteoviolacea]KID55686.1 LacI family transcriptional regulator [Pseudoalteromonas luteoviolacea]KID56410.1 LacI family transcriptional regulator [Pseudoalteromonas luteoviolacea]